jgi:starch synthase
MVRAWEGFQYRQPWHDLQQRGMAMDFSWDKSALEYNRLYNAARGLPEDQLPKPPKPALSLKA